MSQSCVSGSQALDIYRNTCLRYLGYFGTFGRLFSSFMPPNIAKMVATTYIVSDVADKSLEVSGQGKGKCRAIITASDAIIWQTVSSIIIPGFLLKSIQSNMRRLRINRRMLPFSPSNVPYILGIAALPILSGPIDQTVNYIMDNSYRKFLKDNTKKMCDGPDSEGLLKNKTDDDINNVYTELINNNQNKKPEKKPNNNNNNNNKKKPNQSNQPKKPKEK